MAIRRTGSDVAAMSVVLLSRMSRSAAGEAWAGRFAMASCVSSPLSYSTELLLPSACRDHARRAWPYGRASSQMMLQRATN